MSEYHTATICYKGHVVTSYSDSELSNDEFCNKCGLQTLHFCWECNAPIRGSHVEYGYLGNYKAPAYCPNCGKPYPWTKDALDKAKLLISFDELLSVDEKKSFN